MFQSFGTSSIRSNRITSMKRRSLQWRRLTSWRVGDTGSGWKIFEHWLKSLQIRRFRFRHLTETSFNWLDRQRPTKEGSLKLTYGLDCLIFYTILFWNCIHFCRPHTSCKRMKSNLRKFRSGRGLHFVYVLTLYLPRFRAVARPYLSKDDVRSSVSAFIIHKTLKPLENIEITRASCYEQINISFLLLGSCSNGSTWQDEASNALSRKYNV